MACEEGAVYVDSASPRPSRVRASAAGESARRVASNASGRPCHPPAPGSSPHRPGAEWQAQVLRLLLRADADVDDGARHGSQGVPSSGDFKVLVAVAIASAPGWAVRFPKGIDQRVRHRLGVASSVRVRERRSPRSIAVDKWLPGRCLPQCLSGRLRREQPREREGGYCARRFGLCDAAVRFRPAPRRRPSRACSSAMMMTAARAAIFCWRSGDRRARRRSVFDIAITARGARRDGHRAARRDGSPCPARASAWRLATSYMSSSVPAQCTVS